MVDDIGSIDFNKTVASVFNDTGTAGTPEQTEFGASFESMAGTVSEAGLDPGTLLELSKTNEAYRLEQEQKERIAREELAREEEGRRKAREAAEEQRKQEEERLRKEKEEKEAKEREQREQLERVSRQAKELEERLERLATSMPPPQTAVIDPEATQISKGVVSEVMGNNSYPGAQSAVHRSAIVFDVPSQAPAKKSPIIMIAAVVLMVLLGAGIGGFFLLRSKSTSTTNNQPNNPVVNPPAVKAELVEIVGNLSNGKEHRRRT